MCLDKRIRDREFIDDIPHFYACRACGFKSCIGQEVIDHQLKDCEQIGYFEDQKVTFNHLPLETFKIEKPKINRLTKEQVEEFLAKSDVNEHGRKV
jgi:hypothetical protein